MLCCDHYGGTNKSIYFKDNKAAVNVEDEDDYDIYDLDGKEMLPTELKEWDVLEAYKAADNSYTKYVVVRKCRRRYCNFNKKIK